MSDIEQDKRIKKLTEQVIEHQNHYYNHAPTISDAEFDELWDTLRNLDPNNELFKTVGYDRDTFFKKKNHIMPMGSLDKASNEEQFAAWMNTHKDEYYIVQHKLDGASLELQYSNGILTAAVTRGDGRKGDDILVNAQHMQGVCISLTRPLNVAIRGEVIMYRKILQEHFLDKKNCRNAANGLMKRKDAQGVALLNVVCYDMWLSDDKERAQTQYSELDKFALLQELGFTTVEYKVYTTIEEINEYRIQVSKERPNMEYDIDGLVVKLPLAIDDDMQKLRPDRQLAYKFSAEMAKTKVLDIEWSESGHLYTPIAILEPVQLAGTTVQRASVVHPSHMEELGIGIGAEVLVVKRGEIIPKIDKVLVPSSRDIAIPQICSTCGETVVNEGKRVYCSNMTCRRRLLFRIERWCDMLELYSWGSAFIYQLVMTEKLVNSIGDLYRLQLEVLNTLERSGMLIAKKRLDILHAHTAISFPMFFAGLGIDGVSLLTAQKIEQAGYGTWDSLIRAKESELLTIHEIGPKTIQKIKESIELLHDEVVDLLNIITITTPNRDSDKKALTGKSFCFTGTLSMPRQKIQKIVTEHGGSIASSVSKTLHYLVTNDAQSNSSKNKKAKEYGIAIIAEKDFFAMIQK